jgi:hypothetical protein
MLSQTCDTLVATGAPEEKARAAAEEIAGREDRLNAIPIDIAMIKGDIATIKMQLSGIVTKAWVHGQTFVLLGGGVALLTMLH